MIRDRGRQVTLERVLRGVDERSLDETAARRIGALLASSRTSDVVDAAVAIVASAGDELLTSDPADLRLLVGDHGIVVTPV